MAAVPFACRCGRVRGTLDPAGWTRVVCHCADCRAAAVHVERRAPQGGADIFQTTPDRLRIGSGLEHVACFRLAPAGLTRWYATCCRTPLANTMGRAGFPFVGVLTAAVPDAARAALGVPAGEVNRRGPDGRVRHSGFLRIGAALLRRAVVSRLAGRERRSPFFGPDDRPIRRPEVLTEADRSRAYAGG